MVVQIKKRPSLDYNLIIIQKVSESIPVIVYDDSEMTKSYRNSHFLSFVEGKSKSKYIMLSMCVCGRNQESIFTISKY